jgi:hypothetical protein
MALDLFGNIVSGVAGGVFGDKIRKWIDNVSGNPPSEQTTKDEILQRIDENLALLTRSETQQRKRDVSQISMLSKGTADDKYSKFQRVESYGRNHVYLTSDTAFTLEYDTGGTIAIPASTPTRIRTDARIGLTNADASDQRLVQILATDD